VYVEGRIQTSTYEKEGQTHYSTEIIGNEMQMLGSRQGMGGGDFNQSAPASKPQPAAAANGPSDDFDDDIPF
jgi:single-strand DNA-binding protein